MSWGFSVAEDLVTHALIRTFTILKTIKSISGEEIIKKDRTTLVKNIQRLTEAEDLLYNQLKMLSGIIDGRVSLTEIIDSAFLRRFSERVYSAKLRWNYVKKCYEILQELINCCFFTDKGIYTAYTTIKPEEKKSTEIYAEIIDYLSKKMLGSKMTKKVLRRAKENRIVYVGRIKKNRIVETFGKRFKIEELFEKEKLCKRTVEGKEFFLASKVVNIPGVGRVRIVKSVEDKKRTLLFGFY